MKKIKPKSTEINTVVKPGDLVIAQSTMKSFHLVLEIHKELGIKSVDYLERYKEQEITWGRFGDDGYCQFTIYRNEP